MLRCAASFVTATYPEVRLIPQYLRALPMYFLRNRLLFSRIRLFYEVIKVMGERLIIGRIPYANVFPIFYVLDHEIDCSEYIFVEGVPSRLNRMLREGEVDISP